MNHELLVCATREDAGHAAAEFVVSVARHSIEARGSFRFAVSGGRTPWPMFTDLTPAGMPWRDTVLYQVDERLAPRNHPERNLFNLLQSLGGAPVEIVPMPVETPDLDSASADYGSALPSRFDLVHLGLGQNGHTASLMPGDPVLEVTDRPVALTGTYDGFKRMTLTYPGLARADRLLWLVTGVEKQQPLASLISGRGGITASRVVAGRSLIIADRDAAGRLRSTPGIGSADEYFDRRPTGVDAPAS